MKLKFIGIDVSKKTLDICILEQKTKLFNIKNTEESIRKFFDKTLKDKSFEYHICIENTGKYSWLLESVLSTMECKFYVVNPLHLKRSLGLVRGKNDKIDAVRIANFIKKNYEETALFIPQREEIRAIQILLSERRFKVEQCKQLEVKNKELELLQNSALENLLAADNEKLISELNEQIKRIEKEIQRIIKNDDTMKKLDEQMQSVPGVGKILSWNFLAKTNEFKNITTPRKFACYTGIAPFKNTSGTSVFGRSRVSLFADKSLKKLLHLGAMSAIRLENDLSIYYRRKVEEGKNKMSVLNAIRNKIVHIIFALIKNQNFYQNRLVLS